jgi:hypothetical protein
VGSRASFVELRRPRRGSLGLVPILALLVVAGVTLLVWLSGGSGSEPSRQTASESERGTAPRSYALPGARGSDDAREQYKRVAAQGVAADLRNSVLPMRETSFGNGTRLRIPLWLASRQSCNPGDLTALAGDVRRSSRKRVLVSLEPLRPEDDVMEPVTKRISVDEVLRGHRVEFDVQLKRVPAQLGLFVCRDDQEQGRCGTKDPVDYERVWGEIDAELRKPQPEAAPDRTYAFQYVHVESDGRLLTFQDSPVAAQTWDVLARRVAAWSGGDDASRSLERARELTKRLDSVPLDARSGHWVFVLPSRGEKCPSLAQLATEPGGAELRALLDELPPEARRRK